MDPDPPVRGRLQPFVPASAAAIRNAFALERHCDVATAEQTTLDAAPGTARTTSSSVRLRLV